MSQGSIQWQLTASAPSYSTFPANLTRALSQLHLTNGVCLSGGYIRSKRPVVLLAATRLYQEQTTDFRLADELTAKSDNLLVTLR